jgi:hypothetical protein
VTRRVVRLTSADQPLLDVFSAARQGPSERLSIPQIEQIRRTVRRTPEVMVKVTGGGRSVRAVAAHIAYIGHYGEVELESDRGERIREDAQEEFLRTWHLEVSTGQYRSKLPARSVASGIKLVHNVVLAIPQAPRRTECAPLRGPSRVRSSAHIVTSSRFTRISGIRMCTWS